MTFELAGGRITRLAAYLTRNEALEAIEAG
jgi:hypothetical protein